MCTHKTQVQELTNLANYYTTGHVDANHYTKTEVDGAIGDRAQSSFTMHAEGDEVNGGDCNGTHATFHFPRDWCRFK